MAIEYPDYDANLDDEPWQYYVLGIWAREDGFYLGTDSGCSCYSPWENYTAADLTGPLTFEQAAEESRSLATGAYAKGQVEAMLRSIQTA